MRLAVLLLAAPAIAFASHPLITEDTGVLGKGVSQLELHGERIRDNGVRDTESALTLSHGITEKADFQVEVPLSNGSDALLSLKWRFLERLGIELAPSDSVDLGLGVKEGLGEPADDRALLAGIKVRW